MTIENLWFEIDLFKEADKEDERKLIEMFNNKISVLKSKALNEMRMKF